MSVYSGIVEKGSARGSALGFPTANIPLDQNIAGIYAARVVVDGQKYIAAAFADPNRKILEAHALDAVLDVYGKKISIELCKKIRGSRSFESDDSLRAAIADDVAKVREYFSRRA